MRTVLWIPILTLGLFLCAFPDISCAEVVAAVGRDGTLTLEDGKKLSLAGVRMDEEGASVLRVLAHKQDVRIEILRTVRGELGGECAYVYLNTKSIRVPFKTHAAPGHEEVLLNEFLIDIGAAKVDESQEFSKRALFLKAQEEAKKKGEGVWSYLAPPN